MSRFASRGMISLERKDKFVSRCIVRDAPYELFALQLVFGGGLTTLDGTRGDPEMKVKEVLGRMGTSGRKVQEGVQ